KAQRYPGRPTLAELFPSPEVTSTNKKQRNSVIQKAHYSYGYTLKEIGDHLGIHYTTVSRVAKSSNFKI
ncbi:MAG: hypothetical protein OEY01_16915, partial [Desulfobulbaceae bacterium]|nr:hypothetical protein [Desulfobulbaceae bacterium]